MEQRIISIWFCSLLADWQLIRRPELANQPFVFAAADHGRMLVKAVSENAVSFGVEVGMRAADAKAICPGLQVLDDKPGRPFKLLKGLGEWCVRYSPIVAIDDFAMDGLLLDAGGCAHLWGGEEDYICEIISRFKSKGYNVKLAIADTTGAAWAIARFGHTSTIIQAGGHINALQDLPPEALRLDQITLVKLRKLGFYHIKSFMAIPRSVLRRRFGELILLRLAQAFGTEKEVFQPLKVPALYYERLTSLEPIRTRTGIELGITNMLEVLCKRLQAESKGLRLGTLTVHRIDGKMMQVSVGTSVASYSVSHLFKLFQLKIDQIRPGLGIELFELEAVKVELLQASQDALWMAQPGLNSKSVIQLIDRVAGKAGPNSVHRYVPATKYWPERSQIETSSITEVKMAEWNTDKPRPTELLDKPNPVQVMALIPDHPPKFFIYKGEQHTVVKADGPERIEREWWMDAGEHRDYYRLEDIQGRRYWLYRLGHYDSEKGYQWFIHGFFA